MTGYGRPARRDEQGSAVVEFVTLGVLLLLPLVYLVMTLARVQAGSFAVSQAAREAGRAFVTAPSGSDASGRARAAASVAFGDFRFEDVGRLDLACDGSPCLRPDGRVRATATVRVPLPLVPTFLDGALPTSIPVSASHIETVDRFRTLP
ncbi:pilus assembly protein [Phycicoccus flavus]|uniref:pilus assembly protein n=1 Tax=Phycicoccus flavus TaxID=2502783 RepID=UPI000FEC1F0C|nr:pilus assembly protein [Phycicoccus flavus]NHA69229.1 pilus assembly protein [Phycicoccus flavus]